MTRSAITFIAGLLLGARCAGCLRRGAETPCAGCLRAIAETPSAPHAVFVDRPPVSRLVRAGKGGRWRRAGRVLADLTIDRIGPDLRAHRFGAVTWVAADPARRVERGVHLPEVVARRLALHLQVPAQSLLARRHGRPQRGLDRAERLRNVRGAFVAGAVTQAVPNGGSTRRILLVDDVRTTGATLDVASSVLRARGFDPVPLAMIGVPPPSGWSFPTDFSRAEPALPITGVTYGEPAQGGQYRQKVRVAGFWRQFPGETTMQARRPDAPGLWVRRPYETARSNE